jgi:ATP-dependent RNA helicase DDX5/DBP2
MSSSSKGSVSRTGSSQSTVIFRENLGLRVKLESLPGSEPNIPDPYDENCIECHTKEEEDSPSLLTLAKHVFFRLSQKEKTKWSPTPIQLQTWPILHQGLNVMAIATTGSGKTLSYAIPMVHSCLEKGVVAGNRPGIHGLVLVPTRELAIQVSKTMKIVCKSANKLSGRKDIAALAIYGGVDKEEQIDSLLSRKEGVASQYIVAATTMRLIDIIGITFENEERLPNNRVRALFDKTKFLVVDEADRIATQIDLTQQAQAVIDFVKSKSSCLDQYCLFSATLPQKAMSKCNEWVNLPRVTVKVNTVTVGSKLPDVDDSKEEKGAISTVENPGDKNDAQQEKEERAAKRRGPMDLSTIPAHITQTLHVCSNHKKPKKLCATIKLIRDGEKKEGSRRKGLIIIFFGRIKTLQYIHKLLSKEGVQGATFHSQMNQQQRESQLNSFRCGKTPILFATDIAARGLHCNNVEYIINYDFPGSLEQVSYLVTSWLLSRTFCA